MHDVSKLLPSEFSPYTNYCFGHGADIRKAEYKHVCLDNHDSSDKNFNFAWLLHKKRNKHHWQWWVEFDINNNLKAQEMREPYLTEMICDWIGAEKLEGKFSPKDDQYLEVRKWYADHKNKLLLNEKTRQKIEEKIKWTS